MEHDVLFDISHPIGSKGKLFKINKARLEETPICVEVCIMVIYYIIKGVLKEVTTFAERV